jgi:hypothetical protein
MPPLHSNACYAAREFCFLCWTATAFVLRLFVFNGILIRALYGQTTGLIIKWHSAASSVKRMDFLITLSSATKQIVINDYSSLAHDADVASTETNSQSKIIGKIATVSTDSCISRILLSTKPILFYRLTHDIWGFV